MFYAHSSPSFISNGIVDIGITIQDNKCSNKKVIMNNIILLSSPNNPTY